MNHVKMGQVTLILIVIIVIAIVVFSVILLGNRLKGASSDSTTVDSQRVQVDREQITNYAENCFLQIAKEGMFLAGKQGGAIFKEQGGEKIDYPINSVGKLFLEFELHRVPYLIQKPVAGVECNARIPHYPLIESNPYYPYGELGDFSNPMYLASKKYYYKDCFGKQIMLDVEKTYRDLKTYTEGRIKNECDFKVFQTYDHELTEPVVEIADSKQTTDFIVTYPMTFTEKASEIEINFDQFRVSIGMSLGDMYDFINDIVHYDVSDSTYDLRRSDESTPYDIFFNHNEYNQDDIITIRSDRLTIDNRPFEFIFARRNRPPALEYVHKTDFGMVSFQEFEVVDYDSVIMQVFTAQDPDEDDVEFIVTAGEGIFEKEFTLSDPYTIFAGDINNGYVIFRVHASDREYEDYQDYRVE